MENQERTTQKPTNTKSFEIDHKRNNVTVILFRKRIFLFALDKKLSSIPLVLLLSKNKDGLLTYIPRNPFGLNKRPKLAQTALKSTYH